jgi:hypothetical protein
MTELLKLLVPEAFRSEPSELKDAVLIDALAICFFLSSS